MEEVLALKNSCSFKVENQLANDCFSMFFFGINARGQINEAFIIKKDLILENKILVFYVRVAQHNRIVEA